MRVTGEGQKFGLEDVCAVSRVVGERFPPPLPVPHDDVEIVGSRGQPDNAAIEIGVVNI